MRVVEAQLASQREVSEQQAVQVSELQAQVLAQEEQLAEVPKYLERWGGGGAGLLSTWTDAGMRGGGETPGQPRPRPCCARFFPPGSPHSLDTSPSQSAFTN